MGKVDPTTYNTTKEDDALIKLRISDISITLLTRNSLGIILKL